MSSILCEVLGPLTGVGHRLSTSVAAVFAWWIRRLGWMVLDW